MEALHGGNLIEGCASRKGDIELRGVDPASGVRLEPAFIEATSAEIEAAVSAADRSFAHYRSLDDKVRSDFLRQIAAQLDLARELVVERAHSETGRTPESLNGELDRTIRICESFARIVLTDQWRSPEINEAQTAPIAVPDMRRTSVPLGPVVVYGASNIPIMGSACGTDVIAALAAGCPVVVKGHPAHPGTSELLATAVSSAIAKSPGVPHGSYAMLQGYSVDMSLGLVRAAQIRAVAFTGSLAAGRAVFDAANARPVPVPVFAEMGSINPLIVLPGGVRSHGEALPESIAGAVTRNVGQLCTKPGLIAVPSGPDGERLVSRTVDNMGETPASPMLHAGIREAFLETYKQVSSLPGVEVLTRGEPDAGAGLVDSVALRCSVKTFLAHEQLRSEFFGPAATFVMYDDVSELVSVANSLDGELTATLWGDEAELGEQAELVDALSAKVGRFLWNSLPTGTPDCPAMHHGGPFPAASNPHFTSIGPTTIQKFLRPVVYQNFPSAQLPAELR